MNEQPMFVPPAWLGGISWQKMVGRQIRLRGRHEAAKKRRLEAAEWPGRKWAPLFTVSRESEWRLEEKMEGRGIRKAHGSTRAMRSHSI